MLPINLFFPMLTFIFKMLEKLIVFLRQKF